MCYSDNYCHDDSDEEFECIEAPTLEFNPDDLFSGSDFIKVFNEASANGAVLNIPGSPRPINYWNC